LEGWHTKQKHGSLLGTYLPIDHEYNKETTHMNTLFDLSAGIVELTENAMDLLSGGCGGGDCGGCGCGGCGCGGCGCGGCGCGGCCSSCCNDWRRNEECNENFNINRNFGFGRRSGF
jgi:hypothetical protein